MNASHTQAWRKREGDDERKEEKEIDKK